MEMALLPFQLPFMQNAFLIGAMISVPTALLSCFLVLKGWSLMGDAVSHAVLPGVVLAYLLGIPLLIGAFAAGMTCALLTGYLSANSRVKQDTVMGVVFFDENHARTIGLRPGRLKAVFFVLLAASTVAALQTVGAFLVIAMVVTPGATAYLLCDRFPRLIALSVAIGTLTSFFGAYASYFLDGATGGIIVCLQTLIFLAAFVLAPKHGFLAARRMAAEALRSPA